MTKIIANHIKVFPLLSILCLALFASGCVRPTGEEVVVPITVADQLKAESNAEKKRYLDALRYWMSAKAVVDGKIDVLATNLESISNEYTERGKLYYKEKEEKKAVDAFLLALRYDSDNVVALEYLLNRYKPGQMVTYICKEGDSIEDVASAVYGDVTDSFLVQYYSPLDNDQIALVPDLLLELPVKASFFSPPIKEYKREIVVARKLFKEKNYEKAIPLAEKILKKHPEDQEASYIVNSSLVRMAEELKSKGKYDVAIAAFLEVDPSFKNVEKDIIAIHKMKDKKYNVDANLLNGSLFQRGEVLFAEKKYLEAMEVFNRVDPDYDGLEGAIARLTEKLVKEADQHYKEGVKLFVNDNLVEAIEEWEQTLQYNPEHRKAMSYTVKAQMLLDKYNKIEN